MRIKVSKFVSVLLILAYISQTIIYLSLEERYFNLSIYTLLQSQNLFVTALKIFKYFCVFLIIASCLWKNNGLISLSNNNRNSYFISELKYISILVFCFLLLSICLAIFNRQFPDELANSLLKLFVPGILAYCVLNTIVIDDIKHTLQVILIIVFAFYVVSIGIDNFSMQNLASINFIKSLSPFESDNFSAISFAFFGFFLYFNDKKRYLVLSILLVLLTFKRPLIVAMLVVLVLNFIIRKYINKKPHPQIIYICTITFVLATIFIQNYLDGNLARFLARFTDLDVSEVTMGRNILLQYLQTTDFNGYGLSSVAEYMNRPLEMVLLQYLYELTAVGLVIYIICMLKIGSSTWYSLILVSSILGVALLTTIGDDFVACILYMTIGSIFISLDKQKMSEGSVANSN